MSVVVRVIAPTGRDGDLISALLEQQGISARVSTPSRLLDEAKEPDLLGPLLIAEEVLMADFSERLGAVLQQQATWSDLPILILTGSGRETVQTNRLQMERSVLWPSVLLERPVRTATLVSSVRAAIRARERQYEIRDAVEALKSQQETLQAVLDNLPVGVLLAKPDGEVVLGNRKLEEILGETPSHAGDIYSNASPASAIEGARPRPEDHPLARATKLGGPVPSEDFLYERQDGTKLWISLAAAPVLSHNGQVTGGVVAVSDIDQQKRSEAALIQNEKLAAVGRLAASISHEINNPLEAVTNLLYLARRTLDNPEEAKAYLASADQELARVSQIASHTLRFHRQSSNPTKVTAQELLAPTLGLYSGRLYNSGIKMLVRHRGNRSITCYEGEVRQVLNNLVGNAIESMRTGGRLLVRTSDSRSWKSGVDGVRITIADTGHGMSAKVAAHVFEAFYTTKGINGTGLGLWISRGIVDKHHGQLRLRSKDEGQTEEKGKTGTVFSLFLPCDPFASVTEQQPTASKRL